MIGYKKATIDDIDELLKVRIDFLIDAKCISTDAEKNLMITANREFLCESLSDGSFAQWVAVENQRIIATSSASYYKLPPHMMRPNGKAAYIGNMFTYLEYRNRGIATKLLALIVEEAKNNGCKSIMLGATSMGRPLYEKFGFKASTDDMYYFVD
jgi:GNAT superfamily N-acetyltransferase